MPECARTTIPRPRHRRGPEPVAAGSSAKLYSPRLLSLSASLADYPLGGASGAHAEARSRTCGSTISIALDVDDAGRVTGLGLQVAACVVGQSAAAIMAGDIYGKTAEEISAALAAIEAWLEDSGDLPDWPGFDALAPALPHTGRHEAILLPWRAALLALSSAPANG